MMLSTLWDLMVKKSDSNYWGGMLPSSNSSWKRKSPEFPLKKYNHLSCDHHFPQVNIINLQKILSTLLRSHHLRLVYINLATMFYHHDDAGSLVNYRYLYDTMKVWSISVSVRMYSGIPLKKLHFIKEIKITYGPSRMSSRFNSIIKAYSAQ